MINKEKNFISAVVYVCDNEDKIENFIISLAKTLGGNFEKFEIICVDDSSSDNSAQIIKNSAKKIGNGILSSVKMSYYQGLEASMNAGIDLSIGDFVFEFDTCEADYEMDFLMDIYRKSLEGYDIVSASPGNKRITSDWFYKVYNRYAGAPYKMVSENFRLLSRRAINRIHSMSKTIPYRKALYVNCGLKMETIFYKPKNKTKAANTKRINSDRKNTAFNTMIIFTDVAYKLSMFMTFMMMLATFAGLVYTIVIFAIGKPIAGYTTMMIILTASFLACFAILAVIIKYLSILVELIFVQQKYVIEDVCKYN